MKTNIHNVPTLVNKLPEVKKNYCVSEHLRLKYRQEVDCRRKGAVMTMRLMKMFLRVIILLIPGGVLFFLAGYFYQNFMRPVIKNTFKKYCTLAHFGLV